MTAAARPIPDASRVSSLLAFAAAAFALLALIIVASAAWPVAEALLAPLPERDTSERGAGAAHERALARWSGQIDGRSLFFIPAAPPPPPPPPPPERNDEPAPPPPPPATYGGPQPVALILDTVWFDDETRLEVGGEAEGDLRVLRFSPPRELVLEWKGVEFTVPLFDRDEVVMPRGERDTAAKGPGAGEGSPEVEPGAPANARATSPESQPNGSENDT